MVRGLVLLFGVALAQDHRPWNRLGERLGLRADAVPKSLEEVIHAVREVAPSDAPATDVAPEPRVGGSQDENGCVLGGGYRWCEEKKKCLREWEEPCKAPATPVCNTGEVVCTEAMQRQGMNCVLGACVKAPGSMQPMVGRTDANGCIRGTGYTWCASQSRCMRKWEESCEGDAVSAVGGARDAQGCVTGGGYSWCEGKQKCLRKWEEACEEEIAAPVVGASQDEHGCTIGGGFRWCENKQKCLREWEEPCEEASTNSAQSFRDLVNKRLSPELHTKVEKLMFDLKEKRAQFKGAIQLEQFKVKDMLVGKFGAALGGHVRDWADAMRKPAPVSPEQTQRVSRNSVSGAEKIDAVVDGAI